MPNIKLEDLIGFLVVLLLVMLASIMGYTFYQLSESESDCREKCGALRSRFDTEKELCMCATGYEQWKPYEPDESI